MAACVAGYLLRGAALLFDQGVDRMLEPRGVLLCGRECDLRLVLLIELVGPRGNDPVVRADGPKLLVKRGQLLMLRLIGNCIQVLGYFPLGGRNEVAQRLQAACVADERSFRQQAGQQVRFRFSLQKPAEVFEPRPNRGRALLPGVHHQVEICVIDCRREPDQECLVRGTNRGGQVRPLVRHGNSV